MSKLIEDNLDRVVKAVETRKYEMRKTTLYKDIATNEIKTFTEVEDELDCENIQVLTHENNPYVKWRNEYADYVEAERCMDNEEIDNVIRNIVVAIENKDHEFLKLTYADLQTYKDKVAKRLKKELMSFTS